MREDDEPATEGDPAWREQMQETEELAERLQPPHEPFEDGLAGPSAPPDS
jgi:hypothetical protein